MLKVFIKNITYFTKFYLVLIQYYEANISPWLYNPQAGNQRLHVDCEASLTEAFHLQFLKNLEVELVLLEISGQDDLL